LEIGFGGSEHLIWQAEHNPNVAVLGAEPFLNGAAKAVAGVDELGLANVRVYQGDGRWITDNLPDASLDCLFVLFPDPWPKSRHNKRRIINPEFLTETHRILKPGGRVRFASDIISYVDWTLTRIHAHGGFIFPARKLSEWRTRPDDWPGTRYEAKAFREGRPCHYFEFIRD
jgi:tRNA (guanine-N7-)-methyltransferase